VELSEALLQATGAPLTEVRIIGMREAYGGAQTALVLLSLTEAKKLAGMNRLRVGLVNCRVRLREPNQRYFKFLAFGHSSGACTGPDRRKSCRRCGGEGHFAAACKADEEAVKKHSDMIKRESEANMVGGAVMPQKDNSHTRDD